MSTEKTVRLELTIDEAVAVWHYFNAGSGGQYAFDEHYNGSKEYGWSAVKFNKEHTDCWVNINNQLTREHNIDPRTLPNLPVFKAGEYKVEFKEGYIKVGCQDVTHEQVEAIYNKIQENKNV